MQLVFLKLLNIFLNILLVIFFLLVCPWLYEHLPALVSWFYKPDYQVGYIFVANVVTTAVTFLLLIPDMIPGLREKASFVLWKQMLNYSFPILILGIAGILNQTADKILFPFLFDDKEYATTQLGIYGLSKLSVTHTNLLFLPKIRVKETIQKPIPKP